MDEFYQHGSQIVVWMYEKTSREKRATSQLLAENSKDEQSFLAMQNYYWYIYIKIELIQLFNGLAGDIVKILVPRHGYPSSADDLRLRASSRLSKENFYLRHHIY